MHLKTFISLLFSALPLQAASVLVDFGNNTPPANWNPFTSSTTTQTLLTSDNLPSGITLSLESGTLMGYSDSAPSTPPLGYPSDATRDAIYTGALRTFTLSGLLSGVEYTLTFYGYVNRSTSRETIVTVGGESQTYEPGLSTQGGYATFTATPGESGEISFTVEPGPNSGDGSGGNKNFILSTLEITYTVPEPSAALLSALGILPLLRRRR